MHVLRIWLVSGTQIELLYRSKGDIRTAEHALDTHFPGVSGVGLKDDFGKETWLKHEQIAGWQSSDYAAELEGALEIARAKQLATEKHQREVQARHGLIGGQGVQMPGNGHIITG